MLLDGARPVCLASFGLSGDYRPVSGGHGGAPDITVQQAALTVTLACG
jgi:hypothetical protein